MSIPDHEPLTDAEREIVTLTGGDPSVYRALRDIGSTITFDEYEAARELAELARAEADPNG